MELIIYGPVADLSAITKLILTTNNIELKDNYYYIIVKIYGSHPYSRGESFSHDIYKIGDPYKYKIITIIHNENIYAYFTPKTGENIIMIIGEPIKYSSPVDEPKKKHLETEDD